MNPDPYEILGISPDSGPAEWKRAYRRLAMRWHPDRNAHAQATERFKEINAAYEQLTAVDVDDEPEAGGEADAPPAAEPARAADIRLNLELSLEEAASGCRKTVVVMRGKPCPTCAGSGEHGMARTRFCGACHGSGRVRADGELVRCGDCGGRGFFSERICPDCHGSGRQTAEVSLEISVPPGMLAGDELRLSGQGEPGDGDELPGHLFLTLVLRSHALFQLRGRDLHFSMPVGALAMLAGGKVELPTLFGTLAHELAAGSAERREIRVAGRGYPGRGRLPAGDLVVDLQPVFPARLDARQRKLLLQAHQALVDDMAEAMPEIAAWRRENGLD